MRPWKRSASARAALASAAITEHFSDAPPDILCFDPIRNLFDGGPDGGGENDNNAMLFFLQAWVGALRETVAPDAGLILCHHTRKIQKKQLAEDPFMALSGASVLRGFYTSGIVIRGGSKGSARVRSDRGASSSNRQG